MSQTVTQDRIGAVLNTPERPEPGPSTFYGSKFEPPEMHLDLETGLPKRGRAPHGLIDEFKASRLNPMGEEVGLEYFGGPRILTGSGVYRKWTNEALFTNRMASINAMTEDERKSNGIADWNGTFKTGLEQWKNKYTNTERQLTGWTDEEVATMGGPEKVDEQFRMWSQAYFAEQTLNDPAIADEGWLRWAATGIPGLAADVFGDPSTYATVGAAALTKVIAKPLTKEFGKLAVRQAGKSMFRNTALREVAGSLISADAKLQSSKLAKVVDSLYVSHWLPDAVGQNVTQTYGQYMGLKSKLAAAEQDYTDLPEALGMAGLFGMGFAALGMGGTYVAKKWKDKAAASKAMRPIPASVVQAGPVPTPGPHAPTQTALNVLHAGAIMDNLKRITGDPQTMLHLWGDTNKWNRWDRLLGTTVADPMRLVRLLEKNASMEEVQAWHDDLDIRADFAEKALAAGKPLPNASSLVSRLWARHSTKNNLMGTIPVSAFPQRGGLSSPISPNANATVSKTGRARVFFNGGFPVFDKVGPKKMVSMPNGVGVELPKHILIDASDTTKALYMLGATPTPGKGRVLWDHLRSQFPALNDSEIAGLATKTRQLVRHEIDQVLEQQGSYDSPIHVLSDSWSTLLGSMDRDPITGKVIRTLQDRFQELEHSPERKRFRDEAVARFGSTSVDNELRIADVIVMQMAKSTGESVDKIYSQFSAQDGPAGANALFQFYSWHGTGAERIAQKGGFSTDYIGDGEGNQMFGWGLYFADKDTTGLHYRQIGLDKKGSQLQILNSSALVFAPDIEDLSTNVQEDLYNLLDVVRVFSSSDNEMVVIQRGLESITKINQNRAYLESTLNKVLSSANGLDKADIDGSLHNPVLKPTIYNELNNASFRYAFGDSTRIVDALDELFDTFHDSSIFDASRVSEDWIDYKLSDGGRSRVRKEILKLGGVIQELLHKAKDLDAKELENRFYNAIERHNEEARSHTPTASLYRVEHIHEKEDYAIWDAPLDDQPARTKEVIKKLMGIEEDPNSKSSLTEWDAFIAILQFNGVSTFDNFYRNMAVVLDRVLAEPDRQWQEYSLFDSVKNSPMYKRAISDGFRLHMESTGSKGNSSADKRMSLLLVEEGLPGHRFLDQGSRRSKAWDDPKATFNTVVYNGGAVRAIAEQLWQRNGGTGMPMASYELVNGAQRIVRALQNPDHSSFVHEMGHAYKDMVAVYNPELHSRIKVALGGTAHGPVTTAMHEHWARAWEAYRREGRAPTKYLKQAFKDFAQFMVDIYKTIIGTPLDNKLSPQLRKLMDEMVVQFEKDLDDYGKKKQIPPNLMNPTTRLDEALKAVKLAHEARIGSLNSGETDKDQLQALDAAVGVANKTLAEVNTPNADNPLANYNPNAPLQDIIGVVPLAARGEKQDVVNTVKILKNAPILSSKDGKAWLSSYLTNKALAAVSKVGNKFLSTGRYEIVANSVPAIRALGAWIADVGPGAKAAAGLFEKSFLNLAAAAHAARRTAGEFKEKYRTLLEKTGWDETQERTIVRSIMRQLAGMAQGPMTADEAAVHSMMREYLDYWGSAAVEAGTIGHLDENYHPISILKSQHHRQGEVIDVVFDNWKTKFTAPDAPLHRKTLKQLGWIEKKPDGSWGRRADILPSPTGGTPVPMGTLMDLPDQPSVPGTRSLRELYLEALLDPTTDSKGVPARGLLKEAWASVHKALGHAEVDTYVPEAVHGLSVDHTQARRIERSVWLDPRLEEFIDYNIENIVDDYATTLGAKVKIQESTNAFVKELTGVDRKDISAENLVAAIKDQVLMNTEPGEARRKVEEAFSFIEGKVSFITRNGIATDPARDMGWANTMSSIAINLSQSAIAGRNSAQQITVEWTTMLANAAFSNGVTGVRDFVVGVLRSASGDELKGLYQHTEYMRSHTQRMIYDMDQDNSVVRSWSDAAIKNPLNRIKETATNQHTSGMRRVGETLVAVTNGLSQLSRGLALESQVNRFTQNMAASIEHAKMSRTYRKGAWEKLSNALLADQARLASLPQKEAEKAFRGHARTAGFGSDYLFAQRLLSAGLLDPESIAGLNQLKNLAREDLFTTKNGINYDAMNRAGGLTRGFSNRRELLGLIDKVKAFVETEIDSRATKVSVLDTFTAGASAKDRLAMAYTSFARTWFNRTMMERLGNQRLHTAVGVLGFTLMAEVLYNALNRIVYDGATKEDEIAKWEENPGATFLDTMSRSNFLGSANILTRVAAGIIAEQRFSAQPNYPETVAYRTLSSLAKLMVSYSDDVEMTAKDWKQINAVVPALNNWLLQTVARATGYKGIAGWMTGEEAD